MQALTRYFTRNSVAANLLMGLFLVAGCLTITGIRRESFPRIAPNAFTISVVYPGASAEQVDAGVTRKIEQALEGMPGVKKITSSSTEDLALVRIQKTGRQSLQRLVDDVRNRIDGISGFPQGSERPVIQRDAFPVFALVVQVYGQSDEATLQAAGRQLKSDLLAHPAISKLEIFGQKKPIVHVELDKEAMAAYGLSLESVQAAIAGNSLLFRSGQLKSGGGKVLLRADGQAQEYADFTRIPLLTLTDGRRLLLGDVAAVKDGFEDQTLVTRFQGLPAIGMVINTGNRDDLMAVSRAAREVVEKLRPQLPETLSLDIWADASAYILERLDLLFTNAWQGLLIVLALLALFLDLRLAFWVAMGIPVAFGGTMALMGERFLDYSLNDVTTFGMILVLGILIDDAIVVGESVFESRRRIADPLAGTLDGVERVATATVFGELTTIAAFFPILLIDNEFGKIFASFSAIVCLTIWFSLVESKLILPAHLAGIDLDRGRSRFLPARWWAAAQAGAEWLLMAANHRIYKPVIAFCLTHRYAVVLVFASVAVCAAGLVESGRIKTVFFPEVPGNTIIVTLKMEKSSPVALTLENARRLEEAAREVNREQMAALGTMDPPIARVMTAVTDDTSVEIYGELQPETRRRLGPLETVGLWRERTGSLEGVESLAFSGAYETGGGFEIAVTGRDTRAVAAAADELCRALAALAGVADVRSDLLPGQPQIRLEIKPEARHLGLTSAELAAQIGNGFGALEVQRIQRRDEEVKVIVRLGEGMRTSMHALMTARIRTPGGLFVPLTSVAHIESGYAPGAIQRKNAKRTATVKAAIDKSLTSAPAVFAALKATVIPELEGRYAGVEIAPGGELQEEHEVRGSLVRALFFILVLIYVLMAVPLRSYFQPLVIMAVIPFGFAGAVFGHQIAGLPLSILSFFGMLAVSGIVVNDSLVMMTHFNQRREEKVALEQALVEAGTDRFRAIFLTTATTVCGLLPLLSETSEQAQYLIPAAASLAYGELFATPVTLVLIPVLIRIGHDMKTAWTWFCAFPSAGTAPAGAAPCSAAPADRWPSSPVDRAE